jgi:hypothetical protein
MRFQTRSIVAFLAVLAGALTAAAGAQADFGIVPGSVSAVAHNRDGTIDNQAGSHPFSYTVSFALKTDGTGHTEGGKVRDILADLPPGFAGYPLVGPRCPRADFDQGIVPICDPDTQVGILHINLPGFGGADGPIYNMVPPPGVVAQLGFSVNGVSALQDVSVRTEDGYGVSVYIDNIMEELTSAEETIWGVPGDAGHDSERGVNALEEHGPPLKYGGAVLPFITLPTSCLAPPSIGIGADSQLAPGVFSEESQLSLDGGGSPAALGGCEAVPFSPKVDAAPTTRLASSASGLGVELRLPDEGLLSPGGVAETEPEKIELALPEGVTANPSAGEDLGTCSEAQYRAETIQSGPGEGCPEASKLGSIVAHSTLLEEPIEGSLYLAKPYENPAGSLIGLYIVARAPQRGVLIKQFGKVIPNAQTGQLVTTFEGLPPLPYTDFKLVFREGSRGLLVTPPACGVYQTVTKLTPFSALSSPYTVISSFQIDHGVEGGACPPSGTPPLHPAAVAGTQNNAAGAYSPFYLRVERKDGEQEITGFATELPAGLTGNLSGIPFCSEAEIQRARTQTGAEALASPACPGASQIGHTIAEAGVGSVLAQTPGELYLAGPFEGAPFSLVSITSAKVGPFDLGTVVVHLPLHINPVTAQISVPSGPSDQIPHIIKGIVIHLRDIRIYIDREHFMINPTSCTPSSIAATVIGAGANFASAVDDQSATATSRFQAADCQALKFKPSFKVSTSGKTSKAGGASLSVKLAFPTGSLGTEANIAKVKVDLPKQLPSRLTTLQKACLAATFEANPAECPAASIIGHAKAITPILPAPLEGPAYFVSHGGEAFPSLVMVLQGYGVTIDLTATTFISKAGITSSTFKAVPDQPVTSFELTLPQGKYSALAANGNLCTSKLAMPTAFTAQNGLEIHQSTPISVTGCAKAKAPTRVQKLAKALRACKKKAKAKRATCQAQARKQYGLVKQRAKKNSNKT